MRYAYLLAAATALSSAAARADIVIPHTGRLVKAESGSDTLVNGAQKLKFSLYSKNVDASGENNLVWEDTYPAVEFWNGVYHVDLGDQTPLTIDDLSARGTLWLEVTVYSGAADTAGVRLSPRMRLAPAATAHWAEDAGRLGGRTADSFVAKADFDTFRTDLTGSATGSAVPWTKLANVPSLALKADVDGLRNDLTGSAAGTTVPWAKLSDVPPSIATALQTVTTSGASLMGDGTGAAPLMLRDGGVDTLQLKDRSVTAAKIAPGAITPSIFAAGSIGLDKLDPTASNAACTAGAVLKLGSSGWTCGVDVGSGNTLPFNVAAPLGQVSTSTSATLVLNDLGITTSKLAGDAVDATKLKADVASLGKLSANAVTASATGAVGLGVASPTARLEAAPFDPAGVTGTGTIQSYASGATTVTGSASFAGQVAPGDLVQLGNLGWRMVTAVNGTSLTIDAPYQSAYNGSFTTRRATLRLDGLVQTGQGRVGIGTATPLAKLDVAGDVHASRLAVGDSAPISQNVNDATATFEYPYLYTVTVPGDASTFYPVAMLTAGNGIPPGKLVIARAYWEAGPVAPAPDSAHLGGLQAVFTTNNGAWADYHYLTLQSYRSTYVRQIADCGNLPAATTNRTLWCRLRGGGTVYHIWSNFPLDPALPTPGSVAYNTNGYVFNYPGTAAASALPNNAFAPGSSIVPVAAY